MSLNRLSNARLQDASQEGIESQRTFTILFADNGYFLTEFIEMFLASAGYRVLQAKTPADAVAIARRDQPDLVLLDTGFGGIDGLALLPDLLLELTRGTAIIMAREPNVPEAVEAVKMGAADYFGAPLDPIRLAHAIEWQKALTGPDNDPGNRPFLPSGAAA